MDFIPQEINNKGSQTTCTGCSKRNIKSGRCREEDQSENIRILTSRKNIEIDTIYNRKCTRKWQTPFGKWRQKCRSRWNPVSSHLFVLVFCFLTILCEVKSGSSKGPPIDLKPQTTVITARPGSSPILPCKAVGVKPTWTHEGSVVANRRRNRFRKRGLSLKIRNVQLEDAGEYECSVSNDLGVSTSTVILQIREDTTENTPTASRPRFTMPTKMRERTLIKPSGSFVRLRCKATGYPPPRISWYKDNNITGFENKSRNIKTTSSSHRQQWTYELRKVDYDDSGVYTCKVWNIHGEISYNYTLKVLGDTRTSPILVEPHPQNTTVFRGGMATFQCRVRSDAPPTVKWIKSVDRATILNYGDELPGRLLNVKSNRYLILPTKEMATMPDNTYLNKLVIRHATENDAGMYICLAANSMGYNYRYAYLTVEPNNSQRSIRSGSSHTRTSITNTMTISNDGIIYESEEPVKHRTYKSSLALYIGLPAGLGLLLVISITVYCQRHREGKLKAQASSFTSGTTKSTRSTPLSEIENSESDPKLNKPKLQTEINAPRPGTYPGMPSAAIPLLNEDPTSSSDNAEVQSTMGRTGPPCPPPSAMSASSTNISEQANFLPPAPPPSQHSVTSSTGGHMYPPPHYHHNPSRRYHHYHHHKHRPHQDHFY